MMAIDSAALTGTVDFSTTILLPSVTVSAMSRAARSTYFKSGALPLPSLICLKFNLRLLDGLNYRLDFYTDKYVFQKL